jgi:hypothetical protein
MLPDTRDINVSTGLASPRRGSQKLIATATKKVSTYQPARPAM